MAKRTRLHCGHQGLWPSLVVTKGRQSQCKVHNSITIVKLFCNSRDFLSVLCMLALPNCLVLNVLMASHLGFPPPRQQLWEKVKAQKNRLKSKVKWFSYNFPSLVGSNCPFWCPDYIPKVARSCKPSVQFFGLGSESYLKSILERHGPYNSTGCPTARWDFNEIFVSCSSQKKSAY
jgi:hypothetical protein